jgi:hypothetical protein
VTLHLSWWLVGGIALFFLPRSLYWRTGVVLTGGLLTWLWLGGLALCIYEAVTVSP